MTTDKYATIDADLAHVFEHETLRQWRIFSACMREVNEAYKTDGFNASGLNQMDFIWSRFDSALAAAAKISKIFWPSGSASGARCAEMRRIYGIAESSGVQGRAVRNSLEHFDERIDAWYARSTKRNLVDTSIFDGIREIDGVDECDYARVFKKDSGILSVFSDEIDVNQLAKELRDIVDKVAREHNSREAAGCGG